MTSSVVYAGIYASVLASLPTLSTRMVLFSTAIADVTEELHDPVDLLFGIQLRGGTNIEKAVAYCEGHVARPNETTFILITDLFEGGNKEMLVRRLASLSAARGSSHRIACTKRSRCSSIQSRDRQPTGAFLQSHRSLALRIIFPA